MPSIEENRCVILGEDVWGHVENVETLERGLCMYK